MPPGAPRSLSGMHARKSTAQGLIWRPRNDQYIMAPRRAFGVPEGIDLEKYRAQGLVEWPRPDVPDCLVEPRGTAQSD